MTTRKGKAQPKQGGYLRPRSVSWRKWHHLLISAAATLASHVWRRAQGPLLHLRSHTSVRIRLLRRPPSLSCISRSGRVAAATACVARELPVPPSLGVPPAYLPQRRPARGLGGPVPSVVHCPWTQRAAGIKVHGVGLLPGNVPQCHRRLREENRTITFANIFLHRII